MKPHAMALRKTCKSLYLCALCRGKPGRANLRLPPQKVTGVLLPMSQRVGHVGKKTTSRSSSIVSELLHK